MMTRRKGKCKMKWYNFETSFKSLARDLSTWLKANKIKYELSDASVPGMPVYHFEIYVDGTVANAINIWLDKNTITEFK